MEHIFKGLKQLRLVQGKTQINVSAAMDYDLSSSLSHLESGRRGVSSEALVLWLDELGINLNDIIHSAILGLDLELICNATREGIDVNRLVMKEMNNK